ncbi:MAG: DNA/RNA nuclease SfsA [Acidobacteria bacterium]|nr:MAG: DNA/RNA nuclease SfsA [Acidobacteriota bacterium]
MQRFEHELIPGTLVRRYKRFLADVELADGRLVTVHCANPGAMRSCSEPGRPVRLSDSRNPKRKLRLSLEMIRMGRTWVAINTARPNRTVRRLIAAGRIPELRGYGEIVAEVPYGAGGRSRVDLLLRDPAGGRPECYVEVKNTTYRPPGAERYAAFPDAVTARGKKHLEDLMAVVASGSRAVIFFHVGRADARRFRPADEIDPAYGRVLRRAVAAGVEPLAYRMRVSPRGIELAGRLPVDLG